MLSKMFKTVLGASVLAAAFLLLASGARPIAGEKTSIVEGKKWSLEDLSFMSKSRTIADAVSSLTTAARETGAPTLQLDEILEFIEDKSEAELRTAILAATEVKGRRKTKDDQQIADFAGAVNPAAVCSTENTAGGHGVQVCLSGCRERNTYLGRASRKGACEMLCTLATSPCKQNESFLWTAMKTAKSWGVSAMEWVAMLSLETKVAFLFFAGLAHTLVCKVKCRKWEARIHKVEGWQWRSTRNEDAGKGAVLVQVHNRLHKKKAFCMWHDFAALATYRASQEAAAAKVAAAKAVAV